MRRSNLLAAGGVAVVFLAAPAALFADPGIFSAHLRPTYHSPHASGSAEFQNNPYHDFLTLSIAVENVHSSNGVVLVLINGEFLDAIHLDHTGAGHLFLSTDHGDDVPDLGAGDRIRIVDAVTGFPVLLKGKFSPSHP